MHPHGGKTTGMSWNWWLRTSSEYGQRRKKLDLGIPQYMVDGYFDKDLGWSEKKKWKENYQITMALYLQCVVGLDRQVGRVLDFLDKEGLANSTLVIFTADHGFLLGEHSWFDKRVLHEESSRMPLIVRYPGYVPAGSVRSELVTNVDFAATILDYSGVARPADWELNGESLRPLLEQKDMNDSYVKWRTEAYLCTPQSYSGLKTCAVVTATHKLMFSHANPGRSAPHRDNCYFEIPGDGFYELYDLQKDPLEMQNLYKETSGMNQTICTVFTDLVAKLTHLAQLYKDTACKPKIQRSCMQAKDKASLHI
eukprot:g56558.t1